jgi:hypothetical protein
MCSGGMRKFQVSIGVVKQFDPISRVPRLWSTANRAVGVLGHLFDFAFLRIA